MEDDILFLKLGGSLITDKSRPHTPRPQVLARLAMEIAAAKSKNLKLRLILGHGSGSFGHVPARKHGTRQGVHSMEGWAGFLEVWREAAALNRLVMDALLEAELPAIAFPASASVIAEERVILSWNLAPIEAALKAGLLPVVYGDVIFDRALNGTIFSTEDLFTHLAVNLSPRRLLLAGIERGVWRDYPACTELLDEITPGTLPDVLAALGGSAETDVTGGMASKVQLSLDLVEAVPGLEVVIFSGEQPGQVELVLSGARAGTRIHST
jgi:isopentenyl phosphate kinase